MLRVGLRAGCFVSRYHLAWAALGCCKPARRNCRWRDICRFDWCGYANLMRMLNREPQVASGPVALALTDMITLLVYFSLARFLLTTT